MTEGNAVQPTPVRLDDPATYAVGPPHEFFTWLRNEAPVY